MHDDGDQVGIDLHGDERESVGGDSDESLGAAGAFTGHADRFAHQPGVGQRSHQGGDGAPGEAGRGREVAARTRAALRDRAHHEREVVGAHVAADQTARSPAREGGFGVHPVRISQDRAAIVRLQLSAATRWVKKLTARWCGDACDSPER